MRFLPRCRIQNSIARRLQSITYHWGTLIHYITVAVAGIAASHYFIKRWNLPLDLAPKSFTPRFAILSLILFAVLIGLGIMAVTEGQQLSLRDVFSGNFAYLLSPLILLLPTMIAYTIMWYGLFLQGLIRVFGNTVRGKVLAVLLTSLSMPFITLPASTKFTVLPL